MPIAPGLSLRATFAAAHPFPHNPRIAAPNFSTLAGPIPSIFQQLPRIRRPRLGQRSQRPVVQHQYAGTRSRFASAARHSLSRAAKASTSADNCTG